MRPGEHYFCTVVCNGKCVKGTSSGTLKGHVSSSPLATGYIPESLRAGHRCVEQEDVFLFPLVRGQVQTDICFSLMVGYKTEVWPDVPASAGNPHEGKTRKPHIQGRLRDCNNKTLSENDVP